MYTNFDPFEDTAPATVTLTRPSRRILITNTSTNQNLGFKFASSGTAATLKPLETVTLTLHTRQVILTGTANYRVWSYS